MVQILIKKNCTVLISLIVQYTVYEKTETKTFLIFKCLSSKKFLFSYTFIETGSISQMFYSTYVRYSCIHT